MPILFINWAILQSGCDMYKKLVPVDFNKADFELPVCGSETWRNRRKTINWKSVFFGMSGLRVKMNREET